MEFSIIAAIDRNRGVGKAGRLPWVFRGDMEHFKAVTTRQAAMGALNAVIMGRTTWLSLPERFRPLPDRLNLVLSSAKPELPQGVLWAPSFEQAFQELAKQPVGEVFVIGGASVYAQAIKLPNCRRVYLTEIDATFDCDTFFPTLPPNFTKVGQPESVVEQGITYHFVTYQRKT